MNSYLVETFKPNNNIKTLTHCMGMITSFSTTYPGRVQDLYICKEIANKANKHILNSDRLDITFLNAAFHFYRVVTNGVSL